MRELGALGANTVKIWVLLLCSCISAVAQDLLGMAVTVKCELDIRYREINRA